MYEDNDNTINSKAALVPLAYVLNNVENFDSFFLVVVNSGNFLEKKGTLLYFNNFFPEVSPSNT